MPAPYVWRGPKTLTVGKDVWNFSNDKITVTLPFFGPMAECIARRPKIGSTVTGYDSDGLKVSNAVATRGDADSGTLEITLEATVAPPKDASTEPLGQPVYELEWGELTKPIETHPDCGKLLPSRPMYKDGARVSTGGKRRTWEDWADLDDDDYDDFLSADTWSLEVYKSIKAGGADSWQVGAPVARRTTYYNYSPGGGGAFYREFPPLACGAPLTNGKLPYVYLKTGDTLTREGGKITRKEEWTGANYINDYLY